MNPFTKPLRVSYMITLCIMGYVHSMAQHVGPCPNDQVQFSNPKLDMSSFIKPANVVAAQDTLFRNRVKCKIDGKISEIDPSPTVIKMSELLCLYKTAHDAQRPPNVASVPALRIIFAMQGSKMVYYFQPVVIIGNTVDKKFRGTLTHVTDIIYKYENDKFVDAGGAPLVSNYYRQVRMRHHKIGYRRKMIMRDRWKGDSREIIFSFQEIFELYEKIHPIEIDRYSEKLAINNGAANYKLKNRPSRYRTKHTVFITGVSGESKPNFDSVGLDTNPTDGANLAHLCPPSCSAINYNTQ